VKVELVRFAEEAGAHGLLLLDVLRGLGGGNRCYLSRALSLGRREPLGAVADMESSPAREQLRLVLGGVVDELTDAACQRVLVVMRGAARHEVERRHRFDGQLELVEPSVSSSGYGAIGIARGLRAEQQRHCVGGGPRLQAQRSGGALVCAGAAHDRELVAGRWRGTADSGDALVDARTLGGDLTVLEDERQAARLSGR
jgi:hypothetical protein